MGNDSVPVSHNYNQVQSLKGFCISFNKQILFNLFIGPWHTSIKFEERTSTSKYKYRFTNCKRNRRWALIEFWNVNHDKKTTFISLSDFYSELTSKTSTFLKCCHPVQLNIKVNTSCLANICKERTKTFVEKKKNWQEVIHVVLLCFVLHMQEQSNAFIKFYIKMEVIDVHSTITCLEKDIRLLI